MKGLFPHFDAEYSYCNHKLDEYNSELETYLAFLHDDSLLMMTNVGLMERVSLNKNGGKC